MNSVPSLIASYLVNSVWEVVVIGGAGWLASRVLKKIGPQAEHVTWVFTLVLAVVMPALPFLGSLVSLIRVPHKAAASSSIGFVIAQSGRANHGGVYVLPAVFALLLLFLYLSSLFYFASRLAWSLYSTIGLLRGAPSATLTPEQDEIWRHCKQSFGLRTVCILSSPQISGPVTLGLRKPILLMPTGFAAGCTLQDFLAALAHECAHIKRRDFQKNIFYEVASLVLAFHPVIWMLKSNIAKTREMVCDGMATEELIDSRSYTQSLLRLASMIAPTSRVSTSHAIGIFDANILEKRIMTMAIKQQYLNSSWKYALIILATLFLGSLAVGGAEIAVVIDPQTTVQAPDQAKPHGPIYHIGKEVSAPALVEAQDPVYPKSARGEKGKFEGTCIVGLIVDESGRPRDVHVTSTLSPDFDANAIEAVQKYRFTPAMRSGEPVAVSLKVEVHFQKY